MIRKTQSLKTPIPFTIVTKMGNFDFLTRDFRYTLSENFLNISHFLAKMTHILFLTKTKKNLKEI